MRTKKSKTDQTLAYLKKVSGGPLTFGRMLRSLRECDGITQLQLAKKLKMSAQNLCDIEKERHVISPAMAAKMAKIMGYPEVLFVTKALQGILKKHHLKYEVHLEAA